MKRLISRILATLLLIGTLTLAFNIQPTKAAPTTIIVPDNYPTIQQAINHANSGDTIFVRNGTYYENIVLNKAVSLVGEDKQTTNIDGNNSGNCVTIQSNGVVLEDFTIENGKLFDVEVNGNVSGVVIEDNFVINSYWGIHLGMSFNARVKGNLVKNCRDIGIFLESSSNNTIIGNTVVNNHQGIVLTVSFYVPEVPPALCAFNTVYHNNFLNNSVQAVVETGNYVFFNRWDNGRRSRGNYWSDGIGDTPYIIDPFDIDHYPLMKPWRQLKGDINDDGVVNILDIVAITSIYGCKKGEPNWNPDADIAPPYGKIDILDLVTCTYHYGEHQ
jgi:nitrous oxidase accessory protein NosD